MSERIEVAVRLRPLSEAEQEAHDPVVVFPEDNRSLAIHDFNGSVCSSSYDVVLGPSASSADVFGSVVEGMLAESMLGKNATIFAYGQTGSGKTHTIEGLMALSAHYVFDAIAATPDREYLVKLSAMEVYNEVVHDLLRRDSGRMELSETKSGKLVVKNLREEPLPSSGQLQRLLKAVRDNRKARETVHNLNSSRSHQIVNIMIESRGRDRPPEAESPGQTGGGEPCSSTDYSTCYSTITFVDLAGSEPSSSHLAEVSGRRVPPPAGDAQQKRESAKINQSLLTLGRVIQHLADKPSQSRVSKQHIPYRDSNLTRLMQPVLGGNSKTAIIATIAPGRSSLENTKATLHFIGVAAKVAMRPVVNTVDDSQSRIRHLEEQVQRLRLELDQKENAPVATKARDENHTLNMQERLAAQLAQNQELIKHRETLARKIAGLERLVLNADQVWRPSTAGRSLDTDDLPSKTPALHSPTSTPGSGFCRSSAITQSMPAFNRTVIDNLVRRRAHMHALTDSTAAASPFASPLQSNAVFGPDGRPSTAAHHNRRPMPVSNPRSPASLHLLDCLIEPQVRSRLEQSTPGRAARVASSDSNSPHDTIKAVQDSDNIVRDSTDDIVNLGASYCHSNAWHPVPNCPDPSPQAIEPTCDASEAYSDATGHDVGRVEESKGHAEEAAPEGSNKADAVEELMAEVRTARYAGNFGEGSDQLRLARLEVKLKALKEQRLDSEKGNTERQRRAAQAIKDLSDEIRRMKAAEERKTAAFTSLAELLNTVKQVTQQIAEADPGEVTVQDIQGMVREHALPEWVGQALTEGQNSDTAAAIAAAPADDGEVVTSRERPMPGAPHSKAPLSEMPSSQPRSLAHARLRQSQRFAQPRAAPNPGSRDDGTADSAGTSTQTHSLGSTGDTIDEEVKAVMVRAVRGMKAQEAGRFKQHLHDMQAKWQAAAEKHAEQLQAVILQYQEANEHLQEQKKWLMNKVLQHEVAIDEAQIESAKLESELDLAADKIRRLEAKVKHTEAEKQELSAALENSAFSPKTPNKKVEPFVEDLLPQIVRLWHELHVPLLARSQFLVVHKHKEVFFFMAEHAHLLELQKDLEGNPKVLHRAKVALQREREWLTMQMKQVLSEQDREHLFSSWHITQIKTRKKALSLRLWDPAVTSHDNGYSSAEITLILYGWDGQDDSLGTLMHGLPHRNAPRISFVDKSSLLVSRAASLLTPRMGSSSRGARSSGSAVSTGGRSTVFHDDTSSMLSGVSASLASTPRSRVSVHQNNLQ